MLKGFSGKSAIILLGHGSRVPDAGKHMEKVAAGLKEKYGYDMVEVCYMSRLGPHLPETFRKCMEQGATHVMVIPYLLHDGLHLVLDIPEMMQELACAYPHVKVVLGKNLGFDEILVDLVERRIVDSKECSDVRDLVLPPRKEYLCLPVNMSSCRWSPPRRPNFLKRIVTTIIEKGMNVKKFPQIAMLLLVVSVLMLAAAPVHAMHISEGILPMHWAALWFALAIPFVAWGLRNLRIRSKEEPHLKAMVGLVGAAVFVISCMPIPVPTAGTCSHPCGTGMAAILIGPSLTVVVASIALVLQALFLAHGGLTTLGANIFSMGVMGAFTGYGVFVLARRLGAPWAVAAFMAGLLSDWVVYAGTSFSLATALHGDGSVASMFLTILLAFVPTQVPLGILEGFITAGAYRLVHNRRPEFLGMLAKGGAL